MAAVRGDLVRNDLISSITGTGRRAAIAARKLVEYRMERGAARRWWSTRRRIEVEPPTEEALTAYLAANAKTYEAPEYRSVTLLVLEPEDLRRRDRGQRRRPAAPPTMQRIGTYRKPEQRQFEQLLATDEATIKRAAEMVAGGQSFTQVAAALKDAKRRALGARAAGQGRPARGAGPDRLGAGRGRGERAGADAVRLAPAARRRDRARADRSRSSRSKDELRRELALERATSQLPDFATRLDDELAAGTPLETRQPRSRASTPLKLEQHRPHGPHAGARSGWPPTG